MSDTTFFTTSNGKKLTLSGPLKACILYVLIDACVSLSQAFMGMDHEAWNKLWWMQKLGFWLAQVGSTGLIIKAFFSNSNKPSTDPVT